MKKFVSLCIALMLALSLAAPAYAAEGGGGVEMMVNGEYLDFDGASPEISGGRTMAPMRGVLTALGAQVDYDHAAKVITASKDGVTLTHTIGTDEITLSGGQVLTMDTASYLKNGNVMVPLRFFSQALDCQVYWDRGQRTAVIIDKKALVETIDKAFTVVNGVQAKQKQALQGDLAMEMDFDGKVKLLDSIGGDREYPFSMEMTGLCGPAAINAEGSMDLSILAALMEAMDEEVPGELAALLGELDFQMIYSNAGLWMEMPALTDMLRESGETVPAGEVWFKISDETMSQLFDMYSMALAAGNEAATMGGTLYAMAEFADAEAPVNIYDDVVQTAELLAVLVGDSAFTKTGDTYAWEMDQEMFDELAEALGASSVDFPGTMTMTMKEDGSAEFALELTVEEEPIVLSMTLSGTSTPTDSSIQGSIRLKNVFDVTFQGTSKIQPSETAPFSAPPADVTVVDLSDMAAAPLAAGQADMGVIGGADGPTAIFVTGAK